MTQTYTAPSIEEFLAQQSTEDDEDFSGPPSGDDWRDAVTDEPLISIAHSLRRIAAGMGGEPLTAELVQETADDRLREAFADLEDKHRSLFELLAAIEKIVKPSTSKVSNEVKAAIDAWKNPEVPQALTADEVAGQQEPVPASNATEMGLPQPARDADVAEWRAYARALRGMTNGGSSIDKANRSQIRTMLGIEQPASS